MDVDGGVAWDLGCFQRQGGSSFAQRNCSEADRLKVFNKVVGLGHTLDRLVVKRRIEGFEDICLSRSSVGRGELNGRTFVSRYASVVEYGFILLGFPYLDSPCD